MFTDIEDITLDKWLDAENAGQDELAKRILDAGLLVEHMIAEIPLDQNLADNSELKQLTDNADRTFGLVVCFGCNRAFQSKSDQTSNCPNCGAVLSRPDLKPTNLTSTKSRNNSSKHSSVPTSDDKAVSPVPIARTTPHESNKQTPGTAPPPAKAKRNKKHVRESSAEKKQDKHRLEHTVSDKVTSPNGSRGPSISKRENEKDVEGEGWFSDDAISGKRAVKSH